MVDMSKPWHIAEDGEMVNHTAKDFTPRVMLGFDPASPGFTTLGVVDNGILHIPEAEFSETDWLQAQTRLKPILGGETSFTVFDETQPFKDVLWAQPEEMSLFAIRTDYEEPTIGYAPYKRKGLTGKKYRQARRAYRRRVQQWKKLGRPMRAMSMYMPRVQIQFDKMTQSLTAMAEAFDQTAVGIRKLGDAWANHPSNWVNDAGL